MEENPKRDIKKEVTSLKSQLNEVNKQKEEWFNRKEDLKKKINQEISKIKQIKSDKDKFSETLNSLKAQRDKYNDQVKKLIVKVKKLNEEKRTLLAKSGIKFDPSKIKEQIDALEMKIETSALSLTAEKKVMDQIRKLKKTIKETGVVKEVMDKAKKVSDEINGAKTKAEEFHNKMKELLKENKKGYSEFINMSREINDLKKVQENAFAKFVEFKNKFVNINDDLKNALIEAGKVSEEVEKKKKIKKEKVAKKKEAEKKEEEKVIKEKEKEVEEKIKKKKKLTTDDLIVFQEK